MTVTAELPDHERRYQSLSNFYRGDDRRLASRERDFGLWWREGSDGPMHRAAWIYDTGELYTVRLGPHEDGGGEVEVLAVTAALDEIEGALSDWRGACPTPDSLRWLHGRAASVERAAASTRRAGPRRKMPDPPRAAANARLAALLSVLVVGIIPAAATAQDAPPRGAYPHHAIPTARASSADGGSGPIRDRPRP
jgi:hypothetical protein